MNYPIEDTLDLAGIERIPAEIQRDEGLVRFDDRSVVSEKYRLMAHRLNRERRDRVIQTVLVTSSIPAEGKTSIAANLAGVLSRNSSRVLLIDADMRGPDLPNAIGLPTDLPGLSNVLAGELPLQQALRCVTPHDLYFLAAGRPELEPVTLLEGPTFKTMLAEVRRNFDWIIIDSPPLAPFADAHCMATLADGILLVVRWGVTPRAELDHSVAALSRLPLIGLVLNSFDEPHHEDYYSYYKRGRTPRPALLTRATSA